MRGLLDVRAQGEKMTICGVCKKKTHSSKSRKWTDFKTGKTYYICMVCWQKGKSIRNKGYVMRAGLKKGKFQYVEELKNKYRRKYKRGEQQ